LQVLGLDFGMKHLGVALLNTHVAKAKPLLCLNTKDGIPNWEEILQLIKKWQIEALVVGIPLNMDGSTQAMTFAARKFANRLKEFTKLPVYLVDERLSSWEAKKQLFEEKKSQKKVKVAEINAYAAAILLDQWVTESRKKL